MSPIQTLHNAPNQGGRDSVLARERHLRFARDHASANVLHGNLRQFYLAAAATLRNALGFNVRPVIIAGWRTALSHLIVGVVALSTLKQVYGIAASPVITIVEDVGERPVLVRQIERIARRLQVSTPNRDVSIAISVGELCPLPAVAPRPLSRTAINEFPELQNLMQRQARWYRINSNHFAYAPIISNLAGQRGSATAPLTAL